MLFIREIAVIRHIYLGARILQIQTSFLFFYLGSRIKYRVSVYITYIPQNIINLIHSVLCFKNQVYSHCSRSSEAVLTVNAIDPHFFSQVCKEEPCLTVWLSII